MSKKILTRLVAVVVVGLRKFLVSTWTRTSPLSELEGPPLVELLELKPRLPGESLARFNQRSITPHEERRAALIIINGRVVKSRISARDPVVDEVAGEYGAVEGPAYEIKGPLEVTVGAAGVTTAIASALGMAPDAELTEVLKRVTRLSGQYANGSVLEAFARALRMTTSTGADPLLERVKDLMKAETGALSARVDHQRLLELLRAALQPVVTVPDVGELDEAGLLDQVAALVRAHQRNLVSLKPFAEQAAINRSRRATLKVRAIELEGDNLSIEAIGEAIKIATGGDDGAQ